MAINVSSSLQATIRRQLSKAVLPLTQNYLVLQQFAKKIKLNEGEGVTWTATRFNRLPLPAAPLTEGVPPVGEQLTTSQVTGVALQWGDKVMMTDVSTIVTAFDLIQIAKERLGIQIAELMERNAFSALMGATQVNYVNTRGARASLVAGDVLDTTTINRTFSNLENIGAPFFNGTMEPDVRRSIDHGAEAAGRTEKRSDHYVAIIPVLVENDLRQNPTIQQAWSYSDVSKLYKNEVGYWAGIHFTKSNMTPRWTGYATTGAPAAGTAGTLATGTYYTVITGTDTLNKFGESQIYAVSAGTAVVGPTGSISITMPAASQYTNSVYIGTTTSPTALATSSSVAAGVPTTGPLTGQATSLAAGSTVVLTGVGLYGVPPAAPATGVTVFPTFVMGKEYFACTVLKDVSWTSLFEADKSDQLNQLRVIGYKFFQGYVILNQQYGCRIESSASNTGTFG